MALLLTGCSLTLNVEEQQCSDAEDCVALGLSGICEAGVCVESAGGAGGTGGGPPDPLWGCLGSVPPPVVDPTEIITRVITLRGLGTTLPEVASVVYCDNVDITCADPEMTTLEFGEDDVGEFMTASFDAPDGSNGFLEINGPTLKPTLLALGQASPDGAVQDSAVTMVETAIFDAVVANAGFTDIELDLVLAPATPTGAPSSEPSPSSSAKPDDKTKPAVAPKAQSTLEHPIGEENPYSK